MKSKVENGWWYLKGENLAILIKLSRIESVRISGENTIIECKDKHYTVSGNVLSDLADALFTGVGHFWRDV